MNEEMIGHLADEKLREMNGFLVEVKITPGKIKILADKDEGITIQECAVLSRYLQQNLDEEVLERYELEVSSPGADQPLKTERQFLKHIDKKVRVKTQDGKEQEGILLSYSPNEINIKITDKKGPEEIKISKEEIKEVAPIINFKRK